MPAGLIISLLRPRVQVTFGFAAVCMAVLALFCLAGTCIPNIRVQIRPYRDLLCSSKQTVGMVMCLVLSVFGHLLFFVLLAHRLDGDECGPVSHSSPTKEMINAVRLKR